VFTCIGTSGKEPLALPSAILTGRQPLIGGAAGAQRARPPSNVDPEQAAEAFKNAFKNMLGMQKPEARQ
jgi:hypothetical protein